MMDCRLGTNCQYLGYRNIHKLYDELNSFKKHTLTLEKLIIKDKDQIDYLTKENKRLKEDNERLSYSIKLMLRKIFKPNVKKNGSGSGNNNNNNNDEINNYDFGPKRGAPVGHKGKSRNRVKPEEINEFIDVYPKHCDKCGGVIERIYDNTFDEHIVEDIEFRKVVICYRLHFGYCKKCKKAVYPKNNTGVVKDVNSIKPIKSDSIKSNKSSSDFSFDYRDKELILSHDRLGPNIKSVGGYLRLQGLPYRKVERIFKDLFDLNIAHSSLLNFNKEQAENGSIVYEGIKEQIRNSSSLNVDETGWRVNGCNNWMWIFTNKEYSLFKIDESRGSKVLSDILGEKYSGTLTSDFYSAYNCIETKANQKCIGHLLVEINRVIEKNKFGNDSIDFKFLNEIKDLFKNAITSWNEFKKKLIEASVLSNLKDKTIAILMELLQLELENDDTKRIRKRIIKFNNELFTFMDNPDIEPTNNRAERNLRPNVIMRKITFGNRSISGARNHEIITSVLQTGILKGIEPLGIFRSLTTKQLKSYEDVLNIRPPP